MKQANGLEGVVAVTTTIGGVDGERGELVVRGHRMEEFAPQATYEAMMSELWSPEVGDVDTWSLGSLRVSAFELLQKRGLFARQLDPMDFLRVALGALDSTNDDVQDALAAAAMLAVAGPAWSRLRDGKAPIAPDSTQGQAADFLRMLGVDASAPQVRALETYLVTVTDHGMNASTFTARVIASTRSDMLSALAGALGALKGPLHGGAPGPVLDMIDAIGSPEHAEGWLRAELARGARIMGMGHRVYRVRDPRAEIFERALATLQDGNNDRLELARAVERAAEQVLEEVKPGRGLKANVEFYTAVLLEAVGIPRDLFTPTFAVGRVLGWSAHVMEQRRGRLIRPRSEYVAA